MRRQIIAVAAAGVLALGACSTEEPKQTQPAPDTTSEMATEQGPTELSTQAAPETQAEPTSSAATSTGPTTTTSAPTTSAAPTTAALPAWQDFSGSDGQGRTVRTPAQIGALPVDGELKTFIKGRMGKPADCPVTSATLLQYGSSGWAVMSLNGECPSGNPIEVFKRTGGVWRSYFGIAQSPPLCSDKTWQTVPAEIKKRWQCLSDPQPQAPTTQAAPTTRAAGGDASTCMDSSSQPMVIKKGTVPCAEMKSLVNTWRERLKAGKVEGQGAYAEINGWRCGVSIVDSRSRAESPVSCRTLDDSKEFWVGE